jgi:hypothetical protein
MFVLRLTPQKRICRPLQGLFNFLVPRFLGLTPQAMHISPLRGSSQFCRGWADRYPILRTTRVLIDQLNRTPERRKVFSLGIPTERRRRGRYLAWGVSPRNQENQK